MASLIPRLLDLQHRHGYLSVETLRQFAEEANVPLYRIQELVSFYPHFRTTPPPKTELAVCRDVSCWLAGGFQWPIPADAHVREVSCLGRCDSAPAFAVNDVPNAIEPPATPALADPYPTPADRYGVARTMLANPSAERLLATLKESGLRGMGGAGFPTAAKWELVRSAAGAPKYVV